MAPTPGLEPRVERKRMGATKRVTVTISDELIVELLCWRIHRGCGDPVCESRTKNGRYSVAFITNRPGELQKQADCSPSDWQLFLDALRDGSLQLANLQAGARTFGKTVFVEAVSGGIIVRHPNIEYTKQKVHIRESEWERLSRIADTDTLHFDALLDALDT